MLINRENLANAYVGFKAAFTSGFAGVQPIRGMLSTEVPSSTAAENYNWLGDIPEMREWIGDRQIKNLSAFGYSLRNKPFEVTIGVDRDTLEDDTYGIVRPRFEMMGNSAGLHGDRLLFDLIQAGTATACYDGQYFFDTDHPVGAGTVSNTAGGGGAAWYMLDTSRPLKPFIFQKRRDYSFQAMTSADDENVFMRKEYRYGVDARVNVGFGFWQMAYHSKQTLDQTNFDAAVTAMMQFKSDEGRPLGITPNILLVGASNRAAAKAVVEKEFIDGGDSNTNYKAVQVIVSPWLP